MAAPAHIKLISARPEALAAFYCEALGFAAVDNVAEDDPFCGTPIASRRVRLGDQQVDIVRFEQTQPAANTPIAANHRHFQHFAIVVRDMPQAMTHLSLRADCSAISADGAHQLPASSGGVTAFKFRDPEGHPLELLQFPEGELSPSQGVRTSLFMAIDHSAITVADVPQDMAFFSELGFARSGASCNRGPEQAGLDGLVAPLVDVVMLSADLCPPHLELLHYRRPLPQAAPPLADHDILATRIILRAGGIGRKSLSGHRFVI